MIVYPALDLMNGWCVRLKQGRFDDVTYYGADPAEALSRFADAGAKWAHIVDLDGARAGCPMQHAYVAELAKQTDLKVQVAGGVRRRAHVERLLEGGAARVVIGSLAMEEPRLVRELVEAFGAEQIAIALDVRLLGGEALVSFRGWTQTSSRSLFQVLADFPGVRHVLVTDVERDGMRSGPNTELIGRIGRSFPNVDVQASGGVARLEDLSELAAAGAAGAIVGKALWEGDLDLAEASRIARA